MKLRTRWINREDGHGENPRVDAFLAELESVYRRHGLALSHEDTHGAFEVVEAKDFDFDWLHDAHDATKVQQ